MKKDLFIDYESIMEIHNAGDQAFLKSILDAAAIEYFIQGEHVAPYIYHSLPMRLMVRKQQAARAKELLKEFKLSAAYGGLRERITPNSEPKSPARSSRSRRKK